MRQNALLPLETHTQILETLETEPKILYMQHTHSTTELQVAAVSMWEMFLDIPPLANTKVKHMHILKRRRKNKCVEVSPQEEAVSTNGLGSLGFEQDLLHPMKDS